MNAGEGNGCLWALTGKVSHGRAASHGWVHKVSPVLGTDRGKGMETKIHVMFSDSNETGSF